MLSLEGGEELCGLHLTHWPPKRYDPASHSGGFTGVDVGNAIQGDELSGTGVEVETSKQIDAPFSDQVPEGQDRHEELPFCG